MLRCWYWRRGATRGEGRIKRDRIERTNSLSRSILSDFKIRKMSVNRPDMLDLTREGRFNAGEEGLEGEDPWNEDQIVLNGEGKGERERENWFYYYYYYLISLCNWVKRNDLEKLIFWSSFCSRLEEVKNLREKKRKERYEIEVE